MKINTQQAIKDFSGKEIKNGEEVFTVGIAISNILSATKEGGKMKMFLLAQSFFKDEIIEIDKADLAIVKTAVEKADIYNNLVLGQILVLLDGIKE